MKAVDLGLSVFWGESPLEIPNKHFEERLFTWGDDSYNFSHNKAHEEDDFDELANNGIIADNGFLTPQYDHAHQILGEKWHMPTVEELRELINKCKWTWIGDGYAVTGPSKNSIKLPYLYTNFRETYRGTLADTGSFWSNEPSFEDYGDFLSYTAYALSFSNPEQKSKIEISTEKRSKKNLIIPVTSDRSFLKEDDHSPIETHVKKPWFMDMGDIELVDSVSSESVPPPIVPNGVRFPLPFWNKLSEKAKIFLNEEWGVSSENQYNKLLNDMEEVVILEHALKNFGLI